jgi:diaminopimelate epimerase
MATTNRAGYKAPPLMATLEFTKLHGTANDFVLVDARRGFPGDPAVLAPRLCDRHRGVGADGLILVLPSEHADARMRIVNADGSTAEMCGNGIRGFAKFVLDRGVVRSNPLRVETDAGVKTIHAELDGGRVRRVSVDMGTPEWSGRRIPVDADGEVVERPLAVDGSTHLVTCVSMGNPHCVVFVDDVRGLPLAEIGPRFEHHPFFPKRVNTEFVRVASRERLEMRVWERGAGETMSCGTGACAAAVAAARTGRAERRAVVALPGGDLQIEWRADDHVVMTGDAVEVFDGRIEV